MLIVRLCQDSSDWRADCEGFPTFDPSSDEEIDERFAFLSKGVSVDI